jgi:[acyl-carrier-protein] S-malonyltransferase
MSAYAFIFPGQGSQYVGMGRSFFESSAAARKTFDEASGALGYDITGVVFEGPEDDLNRTDMTQPALLTVSIATLRALAERMVPSPVALAGHSLGEYTALVASGALDFADAVALVAKRGRVMMEAGGTGAMCAVIGLGPGVVEEICTEVSEEGSVVVPANLNSPAQVVVSGEARAVKRAAEAAKARGAKMAVMLNVSVPSHSPLMAGAAEKFVEDLEKVRFGEFNVPVISNVKAEPMEGISEAAALLERQLTSPVRWVQSIEKMKEMGIRRVLEIGPKKVLTGLVKRIDREMEAFNLDNADELDRVVERLHAD